jgi:purine-binding chemotaxis protein CheW
MSDDIIEEQYLSFEIEKENYAFPLVEVMEIIVDQEITPLPNVSPYLSGVLNLRGEVIPVFSLRKMLHKKEAEILKSEETNKNCIIILMIKNKKYGMRVDIVNEVVNIPKEKIFPSPEYSSKEENIEKLVSINGIGKITEEQVVVILDVSSVVHSIAENAQEKKYS